MEKIVGERYDPKIILITGAALCYFEAAGTTHHIKQYGMRVQKPIPVRMPKPPFCAEQKRKFLGDPPIILNIVTCCDRDLMLLIVRRSFPRVR